MTYQNTVHLGEIPPCRGEIPHTIIIAQANMLIYKTNLLFNDGMDMAIIPLDIILSKGIVNRFVNKESCMAREIKGSVMVVGGGIAGIQAALDAANSGYYVYLVEKNSAIGGKMAQIDKTFPTNDCAM
jgi:heterodisulfide reductase subunit A